MQVSKHHISKSRVTALVLSEGDTLLLSVSGSVTGLWVAAQTPDQ